MMWKDSTVTKCWLVCQSCAMLASPSRHQPSGVSPWTSAVCVPSVDITRIPLCNHMWTFTEAKPSAFISVSPFNHCNTQIKITGCVMGWLPCGSQTAEVPRISGLTPAPYYRIPTPCLRLGLPALCQWLSSRQEPGREGKWPVGPLA